ncbi:hypothetical protein OQJ65_17210 [Vibrio sp. Sgm 22]|uniref:hypothetical protein n=1 Tax=unclassified Vibrio TaxID=2614977 RepID=UPI0022491616|nr:MULTISPECIES: hypothetical protein [unclassified Vibrio]MCX2760075.1 hypothetical protein [Vibrio sp. 14G-20]MCX2777063.1 hypothetical protein [Vibrio sp. Sgm 22]
MINLAKCLRNYLEENSNNIELPFIHKFPRDCCEVTTLILSLAISKNKLNSTYVVAKGYDRANDAWHYWLESEERIIDITADQFGRSLLFGSNDNWNHSKFSDYELIDPLEFVSNNEIFLSNIKEFARVVSSLKI